MKGEKEMEDRPRFVYSEGTIADPEYVEWLSDLKRRFQRSQAKWGQKWISRDCGHSVATIISTEIARGGN